MTQAPGMQPQETEFQRPDLSPEQQQQRDEKLAKIYESFTKRRDKWVAFRNSSGIEQKWKKWESLYDGSFEEESEQNTFLNTLKSGPAARRMNAVRSKVVVNIVRPKVDQAVGRYAEILLPTDGKNWGIKTTAVPELAEIAKDKSATVVDMQTGQPMQDVAAGIIQKAEDAAKKMEAEIEDVLAECDYNGECRKVLQRGAKLGTGIMKGPYPTVRKSKVWQPGPGGQATLKITEKTVPASKDVSCWDIFPDPACGNNIHRGAGIYEMRMVNAKELRNLIGVPGFFTDKIKEVLEQEPTKVKVVDGRTVSREICQDGMYQLWEYHGEVGDEYMEELTSQEKDVLNVSYGMLVIVNDVIIGALESYNPDGSLPYDFWCHRDQDDSPWGVGMPEELEHQQRVVKAAWRQVMDNAAAAAGYHLIIKKGQVIPYGQRDGEYTLTSRMIWEANEEVDDVRAAMNAVTIDMRVQELLMVVDAAMKFADQESNMPQLMGGERGTAPETVGGMQILQANAQGPLRFRIKRWDDTITNGQITRHYDWQMEYSEKMDIKGDFEIEARGSTYLLERDISAMATLNLAAVTNNPRYIPHLDERKELEEILKAMKVTTGIMRPQEQVEEMMANQQPEPDPKIVAAQMNLEAKKMDIQDRQEQRVFEEGRNMREHDLRTQTLHYNANREAAEYEIAMTDAAMDRDKTLMKIDSDERMTREQIEAKNRLKAIEIDAENSRFNAEVAVKTAQGSGI